MKIKVNKEEIVRSKFQATISALEGYSTEAHGDVLHGKVTYSAEAVLKRMKVIKEAFYRDIESFANSIELDKPTDE